MNRTGTGNFKQCCVNYGMLVSIIVVFCITYRPLFGQSVWNSYLGRKADWLNLLISPMAGSGFSPFAAIFPLLPCSFLFCDEYNSGFIRMILIRTGKRKYCIQRIFNTALAGGFAILIPFLILDIVILFKGTPVTEPVESSIGMIWEKYDLVAGGLLSMVLKLLLGFLFGCTWSLVGLAVSTIITNRYAVIVIPFVLSQLLWIGLQNSILNPLFLLRGDDRRYSSFSQVVLIEVSYAIIAAILFIIGFRRKMKHA